MACSCIKIAGILIVAEESTCPLNPFQVWFGFVMQTGRGWFGELAHNQHGHLPESQNPGQEGGVREESGRRSMAGLSIQVGANSARVLFHKHAF